MSTQERRKHELANTNSQLRRQIGEVQTQKSDLKVKNADLEAELATVWVALETTERESALRLERMDTIMGDSILHAHAELMLEYKEGHNAEWDPDWEIEI